MRLRQYTDLFWPTFERPSAEVTEERQRRLMEDVRVIRESKVDGDVLLSEAHRLVSEEAATRSSVETRAGIFLAMIGALVPLLTFVIDTVTSEARSATVQGVIFVLFTFAGSYLLSAGWWAISALQVRNFVHAGATDIVKAAGTPEAKATIAREILIAIRHNRPTMNTKVDAIRMAQMFLWRSIVALTLSVPAFALPAGIGIASGDRDFETSKRIEKASLLTDVKASPKGLGSRVCREP